VVAEVRIASQGDVTGASLDGLEVWDEHLQVSRQVRVLQYLGKLGLGGVWLLCNEATEVAPSELALAACAAISQVGLNGQVSSLSGRQLVADGVIEPAKDIEGRPRCRCVAKWLLALDGADHLKPGFVVPLQLDQVIRQVVQGEALRV
jgi:hypothetical protein